MADDVMYGVKQASKILGMSEPMVRHFTRRGALKCQRVVGGSAIVFTQAQIDEFASEIAGLSKVEVAELCGVTPATVAGWVTSGKIAARMAVINELRFDLADVQKFAAERGILLREPEARKAG